MNTIELQARAMELQARAMELQAAWYANLGSLPHTRAYGEALLEWARETHTRKAIAYAHQLIAEADGVRLARRR